MQRSSARRRILVTLAVAAAIGPAVSADAPAAASATVEASSVSGTRPAREPRIFEATGRVVSITPGFATVAHDEIPGFMTPMTMEFELASPALARGIRPGQRIRFTLRVVGEDMRITALMALGRGQGAPAGAPPR
jgi:Cu/Ag efflux protein CusF